MLKKENSTTHVTTGESLWEDLGFSAAEAAVLRLKTTLHIELMKVVEKRNLTPKQVGRILDMQQPHVSKLLRGKISDVSVEKLTKCLRMLGQQVLVTVKKAPNLQKSEVA